jgi:hypothetical protein
MGFESLQHMRDSRSTCRGPKPARYVPSSGFGHPLDGLLPRIPRRFCFAPAALLGFALRRLLSRKVFTAFRPERTHLPLARQYILAPKRQSGLADVGFWVRAFRKCLAVVRVFEPTAAGASHGLSPSRACRDDLGLDFAKPPLARFAGPRDYSPNSPAAQSIDRSSLRLAR